MGSTLFRMRCIECGRTIQFEKFWGHLTKCLDQKKAVADRERYKRLIKLQEEERNDN